MAYRVIEEEAGAGLRASESHVAVASGPVLFALDGQGRHLLVPVGDESDVPVDRTGRGVQVRSRLIGAQAEDSRPYIDVACMNAQLNGVFATFVDDVLSELEERPTESHRVLPVVLQRWRELLRPGPRSEFTEEKLVGLIGELQLLRQLAESDAPAALECWRGWEGERWDFSQGETAVEVKGTTEPGGRGFWVHGVDQLDTGDGSDLVLHFRRYIADDEGGMGVTDVLADLAGMGVDDAVVRARLAHLGWNPPVDEPQPRYTLIEAVSWRVDADFPRIVASSFTGGAVPTGVERVTYRLELAQPPPVPLTGAEFDNHLARLVER